LKPSYGALAADGAGGNYLRSTPKGVVLDPSKGAHLVALRQMGFELLNSSDLQDLYK
jgi:hypothetical protein